MSAITWREFLLFTALFISLGGLGTRGAITVAPGNIAVKKGTQNVTMMCSTDEAYVDWIVHPALGSGVSLSSKGVLNSQFNETYAIDRSSPSAYDLIALKATMSKSSDSITISTAGYYECMSPGGIYTGAQLIVLKSDPECQSIPVPVDNAIKLNCTLSYAENVDYNKIDAVLSWTLNGTTMGNVSNTIDNSTNLIRVTSVVTIDASQAMYRPDNLYECTVAMSPEVKTPPSGIARNAPVYSGRCNLTISSCQSGDETTEPTTTASVLVCSGQKLSHQVVYEGNSTSFKRSNNGQPVQWQVAPSSISFYTLKNITKYDDTLTTDFVHTYAVNQTELTIFNSTLEPQQNMPYSTAGIYILKYGNSNCSSAANLIVIRRGPVCSCDSSNPKNVTLNCLVDFAESSSQPSHPVFTWKDNSGSQLKQFKPNFNMVTPYMKRSQYQMKISSGSPAKYECQLTFSAAPQYPLNYLIANAPDFTASCFVSCG